LDYCINNRKKPEEAIKMDNPETLATLCTQDTGQRKTIHKNTKKNKKKRATRTHQKNPEVNILSIKKLHSLLRFTGTTLS